MAERVIPYWEANAPPGYFVGWDRIFNAHAVWEKIASTQKVEAVQPIDPGSSKPPGHTRFVCMSDTHHVGPKIDPKSVPKGDILLHAGDLTSDGSLSELFEFHEWIAKLQGFEHKVVIGGNHDMILDSKFHTQFSSEDISAFKAAMKDPPYIFLSNELVTVKGFSIYGSPISPDFWGVFTLPHDQLDAHWARIPEAVDILLSHGPPLGHGDSDLTAQGRRCGDDFLLEHVEKRVKPRYHVFGHLHEGYGCTTNGVTTFVNASQSDVQYCSDDVTTRERAIETLHTSRANPFIVFDLPNKE